MNNLTNINDFGSANAGAITSMLVTIGIVGVLTSILMIAELWIIFKKCGKKGWLNLIPIANIWTLFTIVDLPGWLSLIPVANFVGLIVACFKLPVKFGKSGAYGLGILFLPHIFLGLLAFSKSKAKKEENKTEEAPMMDAPEQIIAPVDNRSNIIEPNTNINEVPVVENSVQVPDLMAPPTSEELAPTNLETNTVPSNTIAEQPALNLGEEPVMPTVEMPAEIVPEVKEEPVSAFDMTAPSPENNEINNTFVVPNEISQNNNIDTLVSEPAPVDTLMPNTESIDSPFKPAGATSNVFDTPVQEENTMASMTEPEMRSPEQNIFNTPSVVEEPKEENQNVSSNIDADLEATFELPKMANEIINSGITETKTCPNCGHTNEYTNKTCSMCGTALE